MSSPTLTAPESELMPVARLNDQLRQSLPYLGKLGTLLVSHEMSCLPYDEQMQIVTLVRAFNDFTPDNDPYKEHDMGMVEHNGNHYYFKIDYYDTNMQYLSPDPADIQRTKRVITIMRTSEY